MSNEYAEMIPTKDISLEKILNNLLDSTNLALKTEISNPKKLAILSVFSKYLLNRNLPKCSKIINDFIDLYLTYMVSYKRESRKEIIRALTTLIKEPTNIGRKLSTDLD